MVVVLVEAAGGDFVESKNGLVGVLDEDELALLALEAHVGNGADDTPAVGEGQVHLVGEVAGLPADDAEDDVLVVGAGVDARDKSGRVVQLALVFSFSKGGRMGSVFIGSGKTYPSFIMSDLDRIL